MGELLETYSHSKIHPMWRNCIETEFGCMQALNTLDVFYTTERQAGKVIFPAPQNIFRAFEYDPRDIRCVIIGQDPYHKAEQAMGLAFSVPNGIRCPPSLQNIKKEIASDIGIVDLSGTDLTPWAKQGVFLLNTALTVEEGKAGSHAKHGWEQFVSVILDRLYKGAETPLAAILWGTFAQKIGGDLENLAALRPVKVIKSAHPSPLSANRGFFGSKPFSQVNRFLTENGMAPIDWSIPG